MFFPRKWTAGTQKKNPQELKSGKSSELQISHGIWVQNLHFPGCNQPELHGRRFIPNMFFSFEFPESKALLERKKIETLDLQKLPILDLSRVVRGSGGTAVGFGKNVSEYISGKDEMQKFLSLVVNTILEI